MFLLLTPCLFNIVYFITVFMLYWLLYYFQLVYYLLVTISIVYYQYLYMLITLVPMILAYFYTCYLSIIFLVNSVYVLLEASCLTYLVLYTIYCVYIVCVIHSFNVLLIHHLITDTLNLTNYVLIVYVLSLTYHFI